MPEASPPAELIPFPPVRTSPSATPRIAVAPPPPALSVFQGGAEDSSPRSALFRASGVRASPRPPLRVLGRGESGQASVELVAALPLIVAVLAVAWQTVLAGEAVWQARVAARAAARANAVGVDAEVAARAHLPARLEDGLRVKTQAGGDVHVSVRVPAVIPSVRLGRVGATSHFRPQGG